LSAKVSIVASDVSVNASNGWDASIIGANCEVVTVGRDVNGSVHASKLWITSVDIAKVAAAAVVSGVLASSGGRIATVISAHVVVIAVNRGGLTLSVHRIADIVLAVNLGASNIDAHVAGSRWKLNVLASKSRVTRIGVARVSLVAVDGSISASNIGITTRGVAGILGSAGKSGVGASACGVASSSLAKVSVRTGHRCIDASISVDIRSAGLGCAHVIVLAGRWADANSSTRAESVASSSTRAGRNSLTSGSNEGVKNSCESAEAWNLWVSSCDSWNDRGQSYEFGWIYVWSNSDREDNHSGVFNLAHNGVKLIQSNVVHSISQHYNHVGNSRGVPSSMIDEFVVGQLKSTSNTSVSGVLEDFGHGVEE
jgi:hypothetical protein